MGWGSWRHGRRGAGPVRSSPPKTVFPGARGSKETVFLLETSSTADATARTGLDGPDGPDNPLWVRPILVARGNQTSRIPYLFISVVFGISLVPSINPTGLVRLYVVLQYWGLGLGLDLDLIWILTGNLCVLFASVHCVISRPVLAGLGETLMTAFLWRSARNASERLHPHHTHTTHVHQPRWLKGPDGLDGRPPSRKGNIGL